MQDQQREIQKRQIACKASIKQVLDSQYSVQEGWSPNYLSIDNKEVSRLNIIGIIVSKQDEDNFTSITVDDSTSKISARAFEDLASINSANIGDIVQLIAKPREYQGERYLLIEILKKLDSPDWLKLRQLELSKATIQDQDNLSTKSLKESSDQKEKREDKNQTEKPDKDDKEDQDISPAEKVIEKIKELDKGEGADYDLILKESGQKEDTLKSLLVNGEVFEISPGKIKVLD